MPDSTIDSLLAFMPDAAVVVDGTGCFVAANQAACDLFGYTLGELVGQPVEMLVPERFRELHRQQRSGYQGAPKARPMGAGLELFGRRKDGTEFPMDASLAPIVSGERSLVIGAIRDITERKLSTEVLARQVVKMTAAVEHLGQRIEVPEKLNERQNSLHIAVIWLRVLVAVVVIAAASVAYLVSNATARAGCRSFNEYTANEAQLWHGLVDKFPSIPPGPDATQSEIDRYQQSLTSTQAFLAAVDDNAIPRSCP